MRNQLHSLHLPPTPPSPPSLGKDFPSFRKSTVLSCIPHCTPTAKRGPSLLTSLSTLFQGPHSRVLGYSPPSLTFKTIDLPPVPPRGFPIPCPVSDPNPNEALLGKDEWGQKETLPCFGGQRPRLSRLSRHQQAKICMVGQAS